MSASLASVSYIAATILFILSLGGLSNPETARRGNLYGIIGMAIAVLATIFGPRVTMAGIPWIVATMVVGGAIGLYAARTVQMTQMPELVALMHSLVGLAACLVGYASYIDTSIQFTGAEKTIHEIEIYIGVLIGAVTLSGSVIAFGKLSGKIGGKPLLLPARHWINLIGLLVVIWFGGKFISSHSIADGMTPLIVMTVIALLFGIHMVMAIGGADMPVVVSMLNSYSGWAAAATGFMLSNDLLIVVGTSLPVAEVGYDGTQFARGAKVVVVDIDETPHRKKIIAIDRFILGDAKEFLDRAAAALRGARLPIDPGWTRACRAWRGRYPVCLPEYASGRGPVNIYHFVERLSRRLTPRDIVVSDAGSAFYAVSQCVKLPQGARYITSGGFATMGYSVPAGIGACIAAGGGRVICITGDGSFQQNIQELQSIAHHSLPIKIFVLNNEGYLSIRFTQERYFEGRLIGEGPSSGVSFPDCRKIANAYGLRFVRVRATPGLDAGLDAALSCDGPVLCEIMSPPGQLIIPTVASRKLPDGRMVSRPLEDMYPFLDRARFRGEMFIPPVE